MGTTNTKTNDKSEKSKTAPRLAKLVAKRDNLQREIAKLNKEIEELGGALSRVHRKDKPQQGNKPYRDFSLVNEDGSANIW